jgi:hypothetical protein
VKLCKDCKHFGAIGVVGSGYCKHPQADFNVVDGSPETYCFQARGQITRSEKTICGLAAKLFEQAPPLPPPMPYQVMYVETEQDWTIWERVKHWFI